MTSERSDRHGTNTDRPADLDWGAVFASAGTVAASEQTPSEQTVAGDQDSLVDDSSSSSALPLAPGTEAESKNAAPIPGSFAAPGPADTSDSGPARQLLIPGPGEPSTPAPRPGDLDWNAVFRQDQAAPGADISRLETADEAHGTGAEVSDAGAEEVANATALAEAPAVAEALPVPEAPTLPDTPKNPDTPTLSDTPKIPDTPTFDPAEIPGATLPIPGAPPSVGTPAVEPSERDSSDWLGRLDSTLGVDHPAETVESSSTADAATGAADPATDDVADVDDTVDLGLTPSWLSAETDSDDATDDATNPVATAALEPDPAIDAHVATIAHIEPGEIALTVVPLVDPLDALMMESELLDDISIGEVRYECRVCPPDTALDFVTFAEGAEWSHDAAEAVWRRLQAWLPQIWKRVCARERLDGSCVECWLYHEPSTATDDRAARVMFTVSPGQRYRDFLRAHRDELVATTPGWFPR